MTLTSNDQEQRNERDVTSGDMPWPMTGRSRLGRGLAALIGDVGEETQDRRAHAQPARKAPIEFVKRQSAQSAAQFLRRRARRACRHSIRERGIIQPIVVRAIKGATDQFEIIAGERRWRAAQRAGLHDVPIVVSRSPTREALELAIIENVQRSRSQSAGGGERLSVADRRVQPQQDDIAKFVGKSRSHVANTLRLLQLLGHGEGLYQFRRAHRRPRAHAGRAAERRRACATRSSIEG